MAKIEKREVIQNVIEGLRLSVGVEAVPVEAPNSIQPVYQANRPNLRLVEVFDIDLNNSDKTFTIPSGVQRKLLYARIRLITTATAGNRRIRVQVRDFNDDILYDVVAINVQVASTTEFYTLGQFDRPSEDVATFHYLPIPVNLWLREGYDIRVFDDTAVAALADDLRFIGVFEERDSYPE